ncbi:MAG: DHHA1 domain-containing protein, partial [Rhodosalinus sp.]
APVETRIMTPDEARAMGAQALFGEKYGDEVRVVSMGRQPGSGRGPQGDTYSIELCGGTHVARTGEIGEFVLLGDSASAAGVRRVEALTGEAARAHVARLRKLVAEAATELRTQPEELPARIRADQARLRELTNEVARLRRELAMAGGGQSTEPQAREVGGVRFLAQVVGGVTGKDLPPLIDEMKTRLGSGAVLLIADSDGKAAVAAGVTDDLTARLSAVEIVRAAVHELGGKGGGGRADMAQGGGKAPENAGAAISAAEAVIAQTGAEVS